MIQQSDFVVNIPKNRNQKLKEMFAFPCSLQFILGHPVEIHPLATSVFELFTLNSLLAIESFKEIINVNKFQIDG